MDKEVLDKYKKAGRIDKECLDMGRKLIKPGVSIMDVIEKIEKNIIDSGAGFAFPINVSINDMAAHDTADIEDNRVFKSGDLIKLDIGVQVDGYIADSAITISLGSEKEELIKVSENALKNALKMMKPGGKVSEISEVIENTIRKEGFNPIINLSGHQLEQYELHAGINFPNVKTDLDYVLKENDAFALEPFVTDGSGKVVETEKTLIYMFLNDRPSRFHESRKVLDLAENKYNTLPFTKRWLARDLNISPIKLRMILIQLENINSLYGYPALREIKNGHVAQSEHTVIVKDKPVITTA